MDLDNQRVTFYTLNRIVTLFLPCVQGSYASNVKNKLNIVKIGTRFAYITDRRIKNSFIE